jgi:DNA-binding MarR family transcriptional regulator
MNAIAEAKRLLPLPALLHREGLGEHAKKSARCPFHEDKHNSFSMWQDNGVWRWKCHASCGGGDEINFLELHEKLSRRDAIKRYLEMAGINAATPHSALTPAFDWQQCSEAFTEKYVEQIANWRKFSPQFVRELRDNGQIGIYNGLVAFPVINSNKIVGTHFRLKSGKWNYEPQGINALPLIFGELVPGERVQGFESTWDGLDYMDKSGERSGVVITRGAGNTKFVTALIPRNCTLYLWTQNDKPGEDWQRKICKSAKCLVKRVKIPAPHKDLNDWTRAGASSDDLLATMMNAEVIREVEKSWSDALNESVVTASQLAQLALKPRRKLLGDWLCEGDLGFIFAFRGVGKTWFALGIGQALATGGKLGDWQAQEPVKVLYVDGEMPPDLIRDRCDGLDGRNAGKLEFLNHEILFERTGKVLNITKPEVQQAITHRCVNTDSKVLILDNLSTLASGMRENEADSWELVNPWLLDLRRRKIAVIIIHHAGRSGEMRGTSKREDNVFWIIVLDDAKKNADDKRGARFISRFTKPSRNTQEDLAGYEWHFVTDSATGEVSISHRLAQTMDVFLGLIEDGITECSEIAEEMKISKPSVSRLAKQAIKAGKITKEGREYVLIESTGKGEKP